MADPSPPANVGLITLIVTLLGPLAGEYATIIFSALIGSLWALSRLKTPTRLQGAVLVLKLTTTAVVLAGWMAWALDAKWGWPAQRFLGPLAFFVAFFGDRWVQVMDALLDRLLQRPTPPDGGTK